MRPLQQLDNVWLEIEESKSHLVTRAMSKEAEAKEQDKIFSKAREEYKKLVRGEGPSNTANAIDQINIFDLEYEPLNNDFYVTATTTPDLIDWTLALLLLTRYSGASITGIAGRLGVSRDHLEGVAIGKINNPKPHALVQLSGYVARFVAPPQLRMVIA